MSGLVLRLSGPLQSWGEHSAFTMRDTQRFPTRSAMIGMFASALGHKRTDPLTEFEPLRFTVRVDRPGVVLTDFHTVGGGYEPARTPLTAEGKRRGAGKGTIVTRRMYLSDAAFTVGVDGPDDLTARLATALMAPRWQPYLGRRSCPPDQPLLLRTDVDDPVADLKSKVPIHNRPSSYVDFVTHTDPGDTATTELSDIPADFTPLHRHFRSRSITVTPFTHAPDHLWKPRHRDYLDALIDYMELA